MIKALIPIITIWIHGTRPTECLPPFLKNMICGIENVLFIDQAKTGLIRASDIKDRKYIVDLATEYCEMRECNVDDFYFYAWSGKLNPAARKKAAQQLHNEIKQLIEKYEAHCGVTPVIEIVAHSHGGNVALLMAQDTKNDVCFSIDRLILLGCPVQMMTKTLIYSPRFKKIYNIHSHNDWIQVLDPQGIHVFSDKTVNSNLFGVLNNFFSSRHFDIECDNLVQVHVRWDVNSDQTDVNHVLFPSWLQKRLEYAEKLPIRRGLFHIEFTLKPFAKKLPRIIFDIESKKIEVKKTDVEIILI